MAACLILLTVTCVACGDGTRASRTGTVTGTAGGGLQNVPVFGVMHPLGPEQTTNGVTTRTYEWTGTTPKSALQQYDTVLSQSTWRELRAIHQTGSTSWQAAWTRSGSTLVVTTDAAPTLGSGGSNAIQMSLLLYPKGTTPST